MRFSYDDDADVLYVNFEEFKGNASYIENPNGDIIRIDSATGKIIGCTVPFFMSRMKKGSIEIAEIGLVPFNNIMSDLLKKRNKGTETHH